MLSVGTTQSLLELWSFLETCETNAMKVVQKSPRYIDRYYNLCYGQNRGHNHVDLAGLVNGFSRSDQWSR